MKKTLLIVICAIFSVEAFAQKVELKSQENLKKDIYPVHISDKLLKAEMKNIQVNPEHYQAAPSMQKQVVDEVGDERDFQVINLTNNVILPKKFRLVRKGEVSQIWLEVDEINNGHLNEAVADTIFKYLETQSASHSFNPDLGIVELINMYMGSPPDVDGDGLVDFLITDVQDDYDPEDGGGYTAGFFYSHDQNTVSSTSNKRDVLYIDSYPGIYNDGTINATRPLSVLAHEYQHLVHFNYNGRFGFQELSFINESQSNFASLLSGYFPHNSYPSYLSNTNVPLFRWSDGADLLADYGRAASFASYLWDQLGFEHSGTLTQEATSGLTGIKNAMADAQADVPSPITFEELMVNWGIANLLNDQNIANEIAYGYSHPLLQNLRVSINFEDPDFSSRQTKVMAGGITYFGFQQVTNLKVTVNHDGGINGQARLITHDGENVQVHELADGVEFTTAPDELYANAYLMLVNTNPDMDADSSIMFSTSLDGEQSYSFTNVQTFGGTRSESPGYFPLSGDDYLGFSNRYTIEDKSRLYAAELYIPNNELQGNTDLKIAIYDNTQDKPATEQYSDTVSFSELTTGWNSINLEHLDIDLQKDQEIHLVYEILSPLTGAVLPLLVDNGNGIQGVTHILTKDRQFVPFSLTIGSNYGVWNRIVLAQEVVVANETMAEVPAQFKLLQNYPNPFNPNTVISFQLSENSEVLLEVFDIAGRKVATLVDDHMAAGNHKLNFNAQHLSSGMYFYTIKAGNYTETRKMILMK